MTRFPTSVDLAGFAPDTCPGCGRNMALRSGNRSVSSFPCQCPGIRADERKRLHHIVVACSCGARFYDPPHEEEEPMTSLDSAAQTIIAGRIARDTGTSLDAALVMVEDVAEHGADSPHAAVVSAAASAILQPVLVAFTEVGRQLTEFFEHVGRVLGPLVAQVEQARVNLPGRSV